MLKAVSNMIEWAERGSASNHSTRTDKERPTIYVRRGRVDGTGPRWYVNDVPCRSTAVAVGYLARAMAAIENR